MGEKLNVNEIIDGVGRNLDRFLQTVVATRSADSNRMIWYVGIAGYVLVNAPASWKTLLGRDLNGSELFCLSAPWVLSALVALVANLVMDAWFERESLQYHAQRVSIDQLLVTESDPTCAVDKLEKILDCSTPQLAALKTSSSSWHVAATWLTRGAFVVLSVAFIWSLLGPQWLRWRAAAQLPALGLTLPETSMSIASQIFALFFAVLYGALFTISDRWRPFFIRHGSREGWHRFRLAIVCFGVLPVLYFVIAFGVMLGVRESDWVRLVLAVYSVAPLAAFHFLWSWVVLGNTMKAYSPEERDLEPVKGALAWIGDGPISAMAVVGLMGIFLLGPILGLLVLKFW